MTGYVRTVFAARTFGMEHLRVEPGTIIAPNHRSDNDVPLLVSALYPLWSKAAVSGVPWPTFAADDHAFLRGFLAGYPAGIPLPLPVKYRLYFGEPLRFAGDPDDDDDVLDEQVRTVKSRIQSMIHQGLREREHVFW